MTALPRPSRTRHAMGRVALLIAATTLAPHTAPAAPPAARPTPPDPAGQPMAPARSAATREPEATSLSPVRPAEPSATAIPFKAIRPEAADAERYVPALVALMTDARAPDVHRRQAALLLGRMGARARHAVPHLARLLRTTADRIRSRRAEPSPSKPDEAADLITRLLWELKAVSLFGPIAAKTAADVIAIAEDVQMPLTVRQAAYEALARIGPAAPQAVAALAEGMNRPRFAPQTSASDRTFFRATVLECIALLGDAAEPLLPALIRTLDDPDELIRRRALLCLYALGQKAAAAQPAVFRVLLFDEEPAVRDVAAATLARLGPGTLDPLLQLLDDDDPEFRRLAASALQQHPHLGRVLPELKARWKSERDPLTWVTLAEAICNAEPQSAESLVPALLDRWDSSPRAVRIRIYRLLQRLVTGDPAVRAAIRAHLPRPAPAILKRLAEESNDGHE